MTVKFTSIAGRSPAVGFREALFHGLAPDGSLYIPEDIPRLSPKELDFAVEGGTDSDFFEDHGFTSLHSVAATVASSFIDDISTEDLRRMVEDALTFPIPLVQLEPGMFVLELFHGPTLAFKDVGARFMAEALSYFLTEEERKLTILVATSGDTGSAVAHGFYNLANVTVYVLYPSGKISRLQEQQMTTLGGNIQAVEVDGTFDDCQHLVKQSLVDPEVLGSRAVTTANSMNLGRLIPQVAYFVWGVVQLRRQFGERSDPLVVVPSGNFGNLTAAVYAKWMGTPIGGFVAATNANDAVPHYLQTGDFVPRPSVRTLSNAMDVGNPSNLARLQALYGNDIQRLRTDITGSRVTDDETLEEIRRTHQRTGYILDPHTAVGVAVARRAGNEKTDSPPIIIAATAHPAKFPEIVERAIGVKIPLPDSLEYALSKKKQSILLKAEYEKFKELLVSTR